MVQLYLVRGLPGAGKSTFAETLAKATFSEHVEADMFFIRNGEYVFNRALLGEAHNWCFSRAEMALSMARGVVVANTFTRVNELTPYIELAKRFGCRVTVLTVEGNHGSVHNVPRKSLINMRDRWERYD